MSIYRIIGLATAALTALACLPGTPVLAAPATSPAARPATSASPDFDRDGKADLAATKVQDGTSAWEIRIWYGSGRTADIENADVPGAWSIGTSLLARDVNGDGYTDLVFSSQLRSAGSAIQVVPGSASGLDLASRREFRVPDSLDARITSLALVMTPVPRLAIGVQTDSSSIVLAYRMDAAGRPTGSPLVLSPGKGKLPKLSNPESFGDRMTSWGSRLFVSAPSAKVGGKRDAGAVVAVTFSASGVSKASLLTLATKGVPGAPAIADAFGASIAARDGYLAVGVPGAGLGGAVQLFRLTSSTVKSAGRYTQATKGIPGRDERGDQFGSAVGFATICPGVLSLVVGADDEVIVRPHDADGSVWTIPLAKAKGCKARQLYEGHGFAGKPDNRGIGGFLAALRDAGSTTDDLVAGGYGSESDEPGRLIRWSPSTRKTVLVVNDVFAGAAGR